MTRRFHAPLRYGFLLEQLVARDFKTRYKRSVLGVFWSLLHPLLTMAVQYMVFSALFRSEVDNYPLYLLSGVVCFNFFTEAAASALVAVVNNAPLITKVHVPIVIYPLSRVASASVNLGLSLLPLLLAAALGGTLRPAALLLPAALSFLVAFSLGVGLLLSCMMVFFRDTQFLWGVASMLWMYLTPVFYPVSILPAALQRLVRLNPLYHLIGFVRSLLLAGTVPPAAEWAACLFSALLAVCLGGAVFRRFADRFILYL